MNAQLGPVGSYINLFLTYDYNFTRTIDRVDMRTQGGALYTYLGSQRFRKFTLPLTWVNSSDRALVNSWWESGANLRFIEDSTYTGSYYDVRITGNEEPFTKYKEPYFQVYFDGQIVLETV